MNTKTATKRYEWEDSLIQAHVEGHLPNAALLTALKIAKVINWAPTKRDRAGLYWANDDAAASLGIARATFYRNIKELKDAGFFETYQGNLIPTIPCLNNETLDETLVDESLNNETLDETLVDESLNNETLDETLVDESLNNETDSLKNETLKSHQWDTFSEDTFSEDSFTAYEPAIAACAANAVSRKVNTLEPKEVEPSLVINNNSSLASTHDTAPKAQGHELTVNDLFEVESSLVKTTNAAEHAKEVKTNAAPISKADIESKRNQAPRCDCGESMAYNIKEDSYDCLNPSCPNFVYRRETV